MKVEIGEMPCPNEDCESHERKRPVFVRLNDENGVLSYNCDVCHGLQYAKPGQPLHESWVRRYCKPKEDLIHAAEKRGGYNHVVAKGPLPAAPAKPATPVAPAEKKQTENSGGLWNR